MALVGEAIQAGIFNDLGSGSSVDMVVISRSEGTQVFRNVIKPNERSQKTQKYNNYPSGTATIISEQVKFFVKPDDAMEIS